MMPIKQICVGDIFCYGWPWTLQWLVIDVDYKKRMVLIRSINSIKAFESWTKYSDRLFSSNNKIN